MGSGEGSSDATTESIFLLLAIAYGVATVFSAFRVMLGGWCVSSLTTRCQGQIGGGLRTLSWQ